MKRNAFSGLVALAVVFGTALICETTALAQGGVEIWNRRYPDSSPYPGSGQDDAVKVMYVNGDVIVAGTRTSSTTSYFQVVKYQTTGHNGSAYSGFWPATSKVGIQRTVLAAAATRNDGSDARVFLAGLVPSGPTLTARTVQVVAFDSATLNPAWNAALTTGMTTSETVPVAIAADDHRVAVTYATRLDGSSGINISLVVLDSGDGTIIYGPATFSSLGNQADMPVAVAIDPHSSASSGQVYVAGTYPSSAAGHGLDYIALSYNTMGTSLLPTWATAVGDVNHDSSAVGIAVNAKLGHVYLTGTSRLVSSLSPTADYLTVALNTSDGAESWREYYDGPDQGEDFATAIAAQASPMPEEQASTGQVVYVTGYSRNAAGNNDMLTIRYSDPPNTPAEDWVGRFDRGIGTDDMGLALATAVHGPPFDVYVTGVSRNASGYWDFVSFRYNENIPSPGSPKLPAWNPVVVSGVTAGDSVSAAITWVHNLSGSNTVYVTGQSFGGSTGNDMYTIRADGP